MAVGERPAKKRTAWQDSSLMYANVPKPQRSLPRTISLFLRFSSVLGFCTVHIASLK